MSTSNDDSKLTYKEVKKKRIWEAKIARKWIITILFFVIIALIIGGLSIYNYIDKGLSPVDPDNKEIIEVEIPLGTSTEGIASILEEKDIINNGLIFRLYVKFKNESGFQAGEYLLAQNMELDEVIETLKTGKILVDPLYTITIPEGFTVEQIAARLDKETPINEEEFLDKMQDREYIQSLIGRYPTILGEDILQDEIRYPLEGYLYAITYPIYQEDLTIDDVVNMMLTETSNQLQPFMSQIEASDFNVHDAITMASLLEREAVSKEDRKMISGVFYNRLEEDMKLQTDPTALYAHGEHKERVLYSDLEIESPYNTYHIKGLPIGPIANFHKNSMEAALNPEEHEYLYFVASYEGEVYYAETFAEHEQNIQEYRPPKD
ncbi:MULTISPECIES: endolytic transglycosylase MltG [Allobacillus]|uniref:Endolytic murein transglycosylase n=1 Tax=Allobacillus salarius TaxID=1955272 RepID=A0A556PTT2_9BACI|nr:endolytic transglycosylase MltG [Allobacillus salarius]TSJ67791.1 endolytic transglycosylase MltG [Allobacillus salarius]